MLVSKVLLCSRMQKLTHKRSAVKGPGGGGTHNPLGPLERGADI